MASSARCVAVRSSCRSDLRSGVWLWSQPVVTSPRVNAALLRLESNLKVAVTVRRSPALRSPGRSVLSSFWSAKWCVYLLLLMVVAGSHCRAGAGGQLQRSQQGPGAQPRIASG